jgi:hypothetical protein
VKTGGFFNMHVLGISLLAITAMRKHFILVGCVRCGWQISFTNSRTWQVFADHLMSFGRLGEFRVARWLLGKLIHIQKKQTLAGQHEWKLAVQTFGIHGLVFSVYRGT